MKLSSIVSGVRNAAHVTHVQAKRVYKNERVQKALFITQIALVALAVLAGLITLTVFYPIAGAIIISGIAAGCAVGAFKAYLHHKTKT